MLNMHSGLQWSDEPRKDLNFNCGSVVAGELLQGCCVCIEYEHSVLSLLDCKPVNRNYPAQHSDHHHSIQDCPVDEDTPVRQQSTQ